MATYGAPVVSDPIKTQIDCKEYHTITSTKVTQGSEGKVNGGESTILYSPKPGNFLFGIPGTGAGDYIPAATTKDGGKTWNYIKYKQGDDIPSGKKVGDEIFGNQAKKSLEGGALKTNTNKQIALTATKASIPPEQQKPLTLNQNTANPTGDPPVAGQFSKDDVDTIKDAAGKEYEGRKEYPGGDLRYPEKMDTNQDCIQFKIIKYVARGLGLDKNLGLRKDAPPAGNILATITLPMPSGGITDRNSVNWQSGELNPAIEGMAATLNSFLLGGAEAGADKAKDQFGAFLGGESNTKLLKALIASQTIKSALGQNVLSRQYGVVINPNLELLFDSPSLRDFSFNFKMTPRSKSEAIRVRTIIRYFKQAMSVKRSKSVLLLKAPHTFRISYLTSTQNHPYLNRFKECALTNCSVNYTPDGQYMSYDDSDPNGRSMTAYELSLSFQELEPIFDDDYDDGDNSPTNIGY
jgi:hypothetical protein